MTRRVFQLFSVFAISVAIWAPTAAHASYSGSGAASYADRYAVNYNGAYYAFGDDCTNFVSQAFRAGGHKFHGTPQPIVLNADSQWWVYNGGAGRTYSWSVADKLGNFVNLYDSWTASKYQSAGSQGNGGPSVIVAGDPVFYIWDYRVTPVKYNHASIVVGRGTDPNSGWSGMLVDQHTTDRYHAIWNLIPYNSRWATTSTGEFHLSTSN